MSEPIDLYCERLCPGFWAEPVNALTNLAFLGAALILWRRWPSDPLCRTLSAVVAGIGVGSFLFHTFATSWAAAADMLPILAFILLYVWAVHRRVWGQGRWTALALSTATLPWITVLTPVFRALPGFAVSAVYWPVPMLILLHAVLLRTRAPKVSFGLLIGACVLILSLILRSLDGAACTAVPVGTHPLWHILNAVMLGWMIEVLGRHGRALATATLRR
ncbi:ceramidase domain-containing protein [Rubellimicrobium arenae]|uniref:ceramidase domain-containing protein n=1 Tax=Rubellimicrobium arenae TaxID=2817372 RepID=UPI001B30AE04|nr:ceramidase domain-containing protein [Rubellimicrobium arenae]